MKKQVNTLLLVVIAFITTAGAYAVEVDGINYKLNTEDKTASVTHNEDCSGDLVIPSQIEVDGQTYSVTSIEKFAFESTDLTSVTIPNSVNSIGEEAFYGCGNLTSVTIPNSIARIGDWTFAGCKSLTSLTIPNSVTSIGNFAFDSCTGLTSISIPKSVTSIGEQAFYRCDNLTSIYMESEQVPSTAKSALWGINSSCIIYVPVGSREAYMAEEPWNEYTIKEYDVTNIDEVETTTPTAVGYYDLHGRRLDALTKGIHVVRYSDGTTRKVFVK